MGSTVYERHHGGDCFACHDHGAVDILSGAHGMAAALCSEGLRTRLERHAVIGRSQSLTPEDRRKLVTIENESPKTKIMTYDDVLENARAIVENLLRPLWEASIHTRICYLQSK